MSKGKEITEELSLGDVFSKTFELYRLDFLKYIILFVVLEAVIGILTSLVRSAIVVPARPVNATPQQLLSWLPGYLGALTAIVALTLIITFVVYPIAYGGTVKLASEELVKGQTDLGASVRFAFSRIIWLWVVGIVVGIIVLLGFIALVIPGIILAIMFSLVIPVLIIESPGFRSLGRSRELVSHRWLKTFALFIVFGIIVGIAAVIVSEISRLFGGASTIASSILSAFYLPLIPIMLTVYYYSNSVRIAPPQMPQAPTAPGTTFQAGMKFCPSCGTQIPTEATFCPACGSKQPA